MNAAQFGGLMETRPEPVDHVDLERLDSLLAAVARVREEIAKIVVGQQEVVDQLLIGLICGGHMLIEGPPGVGKTLLVRTLAAATGLNFARIQFTPDLMPADVTGGNVLAPDEAGRMSTHFVPGPVFTQILLADEINRATPKTQSSLLEAMQEGTVTAGGVSMELPRPFFVLATQNPVENEGTYQLPEAQIDRFMFKSLIGYPAEDELDAILDLRSRVKLPPVQRVLQAEDILRLQQIVPEVPLASHVRRAIARFTMATQPDRRQSPDDVRRYFRFGLSPRGAQSLALAARGSALLEGRYNVSFDDIRRVLQSTLRHRIQLTFEGETDGMDVQAILNRLLETEIRAAS